MSEEVEEAGGALVEAPLLGAPVLPSECDFTEEELLERIKNNEPILSAEEYLARVKLEAKSLPPVVKARKVTEASTTKTTENSSRGATKKRVAGSKWLVPKKIQRITTMELDYGKRDAIREAFLSAREELSGWESRFQEDESKRSQLKKVDFPESFERVQWMEFCSKTPPLLHVTLQLDSVAAIRGVKHITRAIELDSALDHQRASWLFALLARMDVPFTDDVAWTLKKLLRLLATTSIRDDESTEAKETAPTLLIRCLLEEVFKQADADD